MTAEQPLENSNDLKVDLEIISNNPIPATQEVAQQSDQELKSSDLDLVS
jgi:hypothetical protein